MTDATKKRTLQFQWSHENKFKEDDNSMSYQNVKVLLYKDSHAAVIVEILNSNQAGTVCTGGRTTHKGTWRCTSCIDDRMLRIELQKKTYQENHSLHKQKFDGLKETIEATMTTRGLLILESTVFLPFVVLDDQASTIPLKNVKPPSTAPVKIWRHENTFHREGVVRSHELTEVELHPDHTAVLTNVNSADDDHSGEGKRYIGGTTKYLGTWHFLLTDDEKDNSHYLIFLNNKTFVPNDDAGSRPPTTTKIHKKVEVMVNKEGTMTILKSSIWLSFGVLDNEQTYNAPRHLAGSLW
jgi:hypothetical protein